MISLTALNLMVWAATIAGGLVPVVLLALFFIDYKAKTIW